MTRVRPEVVVEEPLVTVEPGQQAQTTMVVRNTGREIAAYRASPVADCVPGPWIEVSPPTFRLMPGDDQRVILRFRPPLDATTPAGTFPYGIQVVPDETEHQAPAVAEGDVAVGAIYALAAELAPPRTRGRWRGKHLVSFRNQGTDDLRVRLTAKDDDDALSLALAPATVVVAARSTAEAFLRVRPRSPLVTGRPVDRQFQVAYRRRSDDRSAIGGGVPTGGEVEASLPGVFTQKPLVSPALVVLMGLLLAAGIVLAALRPWEEASAVRPPDPPEATISTSGDMVVVQWVNTANLTEVGLTTVDCATKDDLFPTATGEETRVQVAGGGAQRAELGPFPPGQPLCVQIRAFAGPVASIWSPPGTLFVEAVGQAIPAPEITAAPAGDCAIVVDFDEVEVEGRVLYEVWIGGRPQPELVAGGGQRYPDQPPGEVVEVFVETAVDEVRSDRSNAELVRIPDDCGGGDADGGTDAADGGTDTTESLRRLTGIWLLVHPNAQDLSPQVITTWFAIGRDELGLDPGVEVGVVSGPDATVELPAGLEFLGSRILFVDAYGPDQREQARADCETLSTISAQLGEDDLAFGTLCFLVDGGQVEQVEPVEPDEGP